MVGWPPFGHPTIPEAGTPASGKEPAMTIAKHAGHVRNHNQTKQKARITAALAVGVLAAAGTSPVDETQPAPAAKPAQHVAGVLAVPALATVVIPNSLYAATGGPPVAVLRPSGS